jgi:hypothetical protein
MILNVLELKLSIHKVGIVRKASSPIFEAFRYATQLNNGLEKERLIPILRSSLQSPLSTVERSSQR